MSAEELKAAMRQYADEHFPQWREASIMVGLGAGVPAEVLVILPTSNDQCEPEFLSVLAGSSSR